MVATCERRDGAAESPPSPDAERSRAGRAATAPAAPEPASAERAATQSADERRERPRQRPKREPQSAKPRSRATTPTREALMGALAWVMMGLAIWHFTIFLPDRFWGGIVGAFLGALLGAFLFGLIVNGFTIPAGTTPTC